MKDKLISLFSWYGVVATVGAYILISFSLLSPTGLTYQLLNFTGALGITIETYVKKDYQPFWLNFIWMIIALVAIINVLIHFSK